MSTSSFQILSIANFAALPVIGASKHVAYHLLDTELYYIWRNSDWQEWQFSDNAEVILQLAKDYTDAQNLGLLQDCGNFTPSGSYPTTGGSGTAGALVNGDLFEINGLAYGESELVGNVIVQNGYTVRVLSTNNPGQTDSNWAVSTANFSGLQPVTGFTSTADTARTGKWYKVAEYGMINDFMSASFKLIMNESGNSNGGGSSVEFDVIIKRQDPNQFVNIRIDHFDAHNDFLLANFDVLWNNTTKILSFYYKPTNNYMTTSWSIIGSQPFSTPIRINWVNTYLGVTTLAAETSDTIYEKNINTASAGGIIWINDVTTGIPTYYATLELASTAAVSGQTINAGPGSYTVTTTATNGIAVDGVNFYFEPGCVITKASSGDLFNDTGFTIGCNVYGYANFSKTTANGRILYKSIDAPIVFEYNKLTTTQAAVLINWIYGGLINGVSAISTGGAAFNLEYAHGLMINSGSLIKSTATTAITFFQTSGANVIINCTEVLSTVGYGIVHGGLSLTTAVIFNIAFCNAYQFVYFGRYSILGDTLTLNVNGSGQYLIDVTGHVNDLICSGGGIINLSTFATMTITGNGLTVNATMWNYGGGVTISSGNGTVNLKASGFINQNAVLAISAGTCNVHGTWDTGDSTSNSVSGTGILIFHGDFVHGRYGYDLTGNQTKGVIQTGGTLEFKQIARSAITFANMGHPSVATNCVVYKTGGTLIVNGTRFLMDQAGAPPIICPNGIENIKVLTGGMNSVEDVLSAKAQVSKEIVYIVATTTIVLNDGSGGNETFTETDTVTYSTTALIAQRMVTLINGSGTLAITASQDTPGTDDYFYITSDVAGTPFIVISVINITDSPRRANSYGLTNVTGGPVLVDADVE